MCKYLQASIICLSMKTANNFDSGKIKKIAELAKLHLFKDEESYFSDQFNKTLSTIKSLNELKTDKTSGTVNVTGLKNVFRSDSVDKHRILSHEEALQNAKNSAEGFFVVEGILDEK